MVTCAAHESRVRPMVDADLEQVLQWRNHPEVRRHMYTRHEITLQEHRQWFERCTDDPRKHLLIFEADRVAMGFINFSRSADGGIADWGFYLAPGASRGSGSGLGRTALAHAFGPLQLHKVCGQALATNERSIRFHQKLSFQTEGVLRDQHFDGTRYHDVVCFGLLRREWQVQAGASE